MFETGGRYPNNRTCPCGLVLLFETRRDVGNVPNMLGGGNGEGKREGSCRTPKTRPYGRAMAVRRDVGRRGRAEQQKHALLGVFVMFGA